MPLLLTSTGIKVHLLCLAGLNLTLTVPGGDFAFALMLPVVPEHRLESSPFILSDTFRFEILFQRGRKRLCYFLCGCHSVVSVDDVTRWTARLAWVSVFYLTPVAALHTGRDSRWARLFEAAARQLLCCGWHSINCRKIQDSATWNTHIYSQSIQT